MEDARAIAPLPSIETTLARKILAANSYPEPDGDVGALLKQSREQHLIYRRNLRHRANGVVLDGDPVAAATALKAAAAARAKAETADPTHADPVWSDDRAEKFPHAALLDFYLTQINP